MNIQATLEKLSGLRLSGMEHAYRAIIETRHPESLTADELVAYLVDAEWDDRQERKTTRLMKTAAFRARATFPEVDFAAGRSLDKNEFLRLSDCSWVTVLCKLKFPENATRYSLISPREIPGKDQGQLRRCSPRIQNPLSKD